MANTQSEQALGTAPIGPLMAKMAVPSVVAHLVNMLYNVVDRIFISQIEQVIALANVNKTLCTVILIIPFRLSTYSLKIMPKNKVIPTSLFNCLGNRG